VKIGGRLAEIATLTGGSSPGARGGTPFELHQPC
jgi:hypothetical protein